MTKKIPTTFEYSAGGVVVKDGKLLLVQVENLQGQVVWTFPKGHLEEGETAKQAALREVREETGYPCEIVEPLEPVQYFFMKGERRVSKRVKWFLMRPAGAPGAHDADEVMQVRWMDPETARKKLKYPSDLKLLESVS
jgi:ADP-ribose pyrophosphatase YjhB (NUDIX family)